MASLANIDELESRLGRSLDGAEAIRALALLEDVSAVVRRRARQSFSSTESTVYLSAWRGRVALPERPVTAVGSVETLDGDPVDFTWYTGDPFLTIGSAGVIAFDRDPVTCGGQRVAVTYTHGSGAAPADIVAVVCQVVGRALGTGAESSGIQQESLGSYSYSVGTAAASGPAGLLPAELAIIDSYTPQDFMWGSFPVRSALL